MGIQTQVILRWLESQFLQVWANISPYLEVYIPSFKLVAALVPVALVSIALKEIGKSVNSLLEADILPAPNVVKYVSGRLLLFTLWGSLVFSWRLVPWRAIWALPATFRFLFFLGVVFIATPWATLSAKLFAWYKKFTS